MKPEETKKTNAGFSRRFALKTFGVAGLGSIVPNVAAAEAPLSRVTREEFSYPFRTFGERETIRVAMIGTVGHVPMIVGDIPELPHVELVAWSNVDNPGYRMPSGVKVYDDMDEMLDREKPHIAGVCLPYHLNATASMAAAQRGIHVMTEKPVATDLDDFRKLRAAVTHNKVRLTALLGMRLEPRFRAIRDAVARGDIGEPILAFAQKSYKFGASRPAFYKDLATYGGTIPWVGIHAIDYVHFTTGLDYTGVQAIQGNKDHPEYPGCQDYAGVLFGLSNGGTALITMDYLRPETAPTHGDDRLRIAGSEGVVEIFDRGERIELISGSSGPHDLNFPGERSFMGDFINELRGMEPHILAPEEAFEMTRVGLLAREAAINGAQIIL